MNWKQLVTKPYQMMTNTELIKLFRLSKEVKFDTFVNVLKKTCKEKYVRVCIDGQIVED